MAWNLDRATKKWIWVEGVGEVNPTPEEERQRQVLWENVRNNPWGRAFPQTQTNQPVGLPSLDSGVKAQGEQKSIPPGWVPTDLQGNPMNPRLKFSDMVVHSQADVSTQPVATTPTSGIESAYGQSVLDYLNRTQAQRRKQVKEDIYSTGYQASGTAGNMLVGLEAQQQREMAGSLAELAEKAEAIETTKKNRAEDLAKTDQTNYINMINNLVTNVAGGKMSKEAAIVMAKQYASWFGQGVPTDEGLNKWFMDIDIDLGDGDTTTADINDLKWLVSEYRSGSGAWAEKKQDAIKKYGLSQAEADAIFGVHGGGGGADFFNQPHQASYWTPVTLTPEDYFKNKKKK